MKKGIVFIFALLMAVQCFSQDTTAHKLKISEINAYFSKPFYVGAEYSSLELIQASVKDESLVSSFLNAGYTDTVKGSFFRQGLHYFPALSNISIGARGIIYLDGIKSKGVRFYVPVGIEYENIHYADVVIGIKNSKRLDTIYANSDEIYVDSSDFRKVDYRNSSNRLFLQGGICMESGKKEFKFSLGLAVGVGASFFNRISMHEDRTVLVETDKHYINYPDNVIRQEAKTTTVKGRSSINTRLQVPFCVRIKSQKTTRHLGLMGQLTPGCEFNSFIGGKTISRFMFSASLGLTYTL